MNLIQLQHPTHGRRVAVVDEPHLQILAATPDDASSVYALAQHAIAAGIRLADHVGGITRETRLDYDAVYAGETDWRILPAFDHPTQPHRTLVSGTGLTHTASARNRQAMHAAQHGADAPVTDSMRMFQWGLERGKPAAGTVGVQPEWFYKGNGTILRAHGGELTVPPYADDGGEEPEIVGCYLIAPDGTPCRVGICIGNEFSDHVMEKQNYLYLAPSKLRDCAIGPELRLGAVPAAITGNVSVSRGGSELWSAAIASGEANMSHALANLEHHHFKYRAHREPGDVHIFFFGADAFSFGAGVSLQDGDRMTVAWDGLGRSQVTTLRADWAADSLTAVRTL